MVQHIKELEQIAALEVELGIVGSVKMLPRYRGDVHTAAEFAPYALRTLERVRDLISVVDTLPLQGPMPDVI